MTVALPLRLAAAPRPDFDGFRRTILRQGPPARVHLAELFFDDQPKRQLLDILGLPKPDPAAPHHDAELEARVRAALGYDLTRVHLPASEFRMDVASVRDPAAQAQARTGQGYIVHSHGGPIQCWQDFEAYPWPNPAALDLRPLEWAEKHLPEGMKAFDLSSQFLEACSWLMGYESLFLAMYDEPDLVEALLARVRDCHLGYTRLLCQFDCIGAIWGTDDMGSRTGPMVSPAWLREHILPLHAEAARIAHDAGKLYLLHSCGRVEVLMPDFIDTVHIDAKHSFEDTITPIEEFHARWGDKVGLIGGLDIDFMARRPEADVRARVRAVLDQCHPGGGYALGTGNSVTNYVPIENYLAMVDEAWTWGR